MNRFNERKRWIGKERVEEEGKYRNDIGMNEFICGI